MLQHYRTTVPPSRKLFLICRRMLLVNRLGYEQRISVMLNNARCSLLSTYEFHMTTNSMEVKLEINLNEKVLSVTVAN